MNSTIAKCTDLHSHGHACRVLFIDGMPNYFTTDWSSINCKFSMIFKSIFTLLYGVISPNETPSIPKEENYMPTPDM